MFTGIIEKTARLKRRESQLLQVETGWSDLALGESVAVNGVCLTVAELLAPGVGDAVFFVSEETFSRTSLGELREGSLVNFERALAPTTRLSGHWVQGHCDGVARVTAITPVGEGSQRLEVALPRSLGRYCVHKGSITLDGVSLTLNSILDEGDETRASINLIPHTWTHTRFYETRVGDRLNVEVDVLAKMVERLLQPYKGSTL